MQIETDCLAVLTMWQQGQKSEVILLIQDMEEYAEAFQELEPIFVRREANQAAHTHAKELLSIESVSVDSDVAPGFLNDIVICKCRTHFDREE